MIDVPPSGCYWCGHLERFHAQRWHPVSPMRYGGAHEGYVPPTSEQILQRMRARQDQRNRLEST